MIRVSDRAKLQIIKLMDESNLSIETHCLRVKVSGGGCSGLLYNLEFDDKKGENDRLFEDKSIRILCDMKSLLYIFNTELDYSDGLDGKGFVWNNPNVSRTCSCGSSFSV